MNSYSQPPMQTSSSQLVLKASPAHVVPLQNLFSSSIMHFFPAAVGRNLATMDVSNLQTSSVVIVVHLASVDAIFQLSNTYQVISLKLTNTNYLYWRMQMKSYLLGQGVFHFVDDSLSCSSPNVVATDGISFQVNHSFLCWKQHGQLILSALLSSLSMDVLHLIVNS